MLVASAAIDFPCIPAHIVLPHWAVRADDLPVFTKSFFKFIIFTRTVGKSDFGRSGCSCNSKAILNLIYHTQFPSHLCKCFQPFIQISLCMCGGDHHADARFALQDGWETQRHGKYAFFK